MLDSSVVRAVVVVCVVALTGGCVSGKSPKQARAEDRQLIQQQLQTEMSLKEDRSELETLRKDIPEETKKTNDELALFLNMMGQGSEKPHLVRDKFHYMVTKRRQTFREKVQRLREDFRREETKRREDFLAKQRTKRDAFLRAKKDSKTNREFFSEQERERQRFFADERDRRGNFEAELNAQSKDFESYMRERQRQFDEQFRLYSKRLSEKPKDKKAVTGESGDDFKKLREMEAEPLGTEN